MPTLSLAENESVGGHSGPHLPCLRLSGVRGGQGGAVCPRPAPPAREGAQRYQGRGGRCAGLEFLPRPLCPRRTEALSAWGAGSGGEVSRDGGRRSQRKRRGRQYNSPCKEGAHRPVMGPLSRGSEHSCHPSFFSRRSPLGPSANQVPTPSPLLTSPPLSSPSVSRISSVLLHHEERHLLREPWGNTIPVPTFPVRRALKPRLPAQGLPRQGPGLPPAPGLGPGADVCGSRAPALSRGQGSKGVQRQPGRQWQRPPRQRPLCWASHVSP